MGGIKHQSTFLGGPQTLQVKLRGFRIELGEIEAQLTQKKPSFLKVKPQEVGYDNGFTHDIHAIPIYIYIHIINIYLYTLYYSIIIYIYIIYIL